MTQGNKERLIAAICLLVIPTIFHLLYSPYGFNPTDEGFVLGYSRRVLSGEIPHVDFISIRPSLSAYLHIPELLIGGQYTLLISRFIFWLQLSIITFIWWKLLLANFKNPYGKAAYFVIGFLLISNNYNPMAWHTIDGIMLASLGIFFLNGKKPFWWLGALLLGLSVLCKQNFLLIGPFAIIMLAKKRIPSLIFWLIPLLGYSLLVAGFGGWDDMLDQFTSETSAFKTGVLAYLKSPALYAGVLVGGALLFWKRKSDSPPSLYVALVMILAVTAWGFFKGTFYVKPTFFLFGWALIISLVKVSQNGFKLNFLVLLLAWSASVSIGLNTPVLLACALFLMVMNTWNDEKHSTWLAMASLAILLLPYHYGRRHFIYRDLNASRLEYHLGDVMPGAQGIYTNKRTYDLHSDLDSIARTSEKLALLPYGGAYWATNSKPNPSLIHWTSGIELQNLDVRSRFIKQLDEQRGDLKVLIPKYDVVRLAEGRKPFPIQKHYPVSEYISINWEKVSETSYFFIYE